jgi:hypothetical protein
MEMQTRGDPAVHFSVSAAEDVAAPSKPNAAKKASAINNPHLGMLLPVH